MSDRDSASALTPFGFTGLESEIYAFLLTESPATGYRISQAIGKPVANTYKAIQTLQTKGAIVVEEGDTRLCVPVPSEELLDRIARDFDANRAAAKEALKRLGQPTADQRIYRLMSKTQVLQRAYEMLESAQEIALLAAPAAAIETLTETLISAAARNVAVLLKADVEVELARVESYLAGEDDLVRHGSLLRLVTDGEQLLVGRVGDDEASDAIWTRNRTLALAQHDGLAAEIMLLELAERIEDGAGPKRLARALTQVRAASKTPGAAQPQ